MKYITLTVLVALATLNVTRTFSQATKSNFPTTRYVVKQSVKLTTDTSVRRTWPDVEDIVIDPKYVLMGGTKFAVDSMTTTGFHCGSWRFTTRDKVTSTGANGKPVVRPLFKIYHKGLLKGWLIVERVK